MRDFIRPVASAARFPCLALMAVCLASGAGYAQPKPAPQAAAAEDSGAIEQIPLSDKQVEGVVAGQKDIAAVTAKIPESDSDKPDPKVQAKLDDTAKKYGFKDFADYDAVVSNVNLVMSGFDPATKKFVGPDAVIKGEIAEVKADKQMPPKDKQKALEELNNSLKSVAPIKFPDNIKVVSKYYDKLAAIMQSDQ